MTTSAIMGSNPWNSPSGVFTLMLSTPDLCIRAGGAGIGREDGENGAGGEGGAGGKSLGERVGPPTSVPLLEDARTWTSSLSPC